MRINQINQPNFIYRSYWENKSYDVRLTELGYHDHSEKVVSLPSIKKDYVIHFILNGKGYYEVRGKKYKLLKNQIFILQPSELVMYYPDKEDPFSYIWIGFDGKDAPVIISDARINNKYVLNFDGIDEVESLIMPILKDDASIFPSNLYLQGILHQVCSLLVQRLNIRYNLEDDSDETMSHALKFIDENYNKNLTVEKISKALSINRTTLFKMFKRQFGIAPSDYIINYKLELARRYIKETKMSFKVISLNIGFSSYHHFSYMFKQKYGLSPVKYRKEKNDE